MHFLKLILTCPLASFDTDLCATHVGVVSHVHNALATYGIFENILKAGYGKLLDHPQ
jgi:hypothetical protein